MHVDYFVCIKVKNAILFIVQLSIHFPLVSLAAYSNFLCFIGSTGIQIAKVFIISVNTKYCINTVILDVPSTLQPNMELIPPMRWSPLCAAPWPNRKRSQCPSVPQQQNLHLQICCATKVLSSALAFGVRKISQQIMFIVFFTIVTPSCALLFYLMSVI